MGMISLRVALRAAVSQDGRTEAGMDEEPALLVEGAIGDLLHEGRRGTPWLVICRFPHLHGPTSVSPGWRVPKPGGCFSYLCFHLRIVHDRYYITVRQRIQVETS